MPWTEVSTMQLREEFVALARHENANISQLCRRFGISRKTGYKWLGRADAGQPGWAADRSRRPAHSPDKTAPALEKAALDLRRANPAWGGRKLNRRLRDLGHPQVPAPSTLTAIVRRHGLLEPAQAPCPQPWQRFERQAPNELWQMDFKGDFALLGGGRCHPLTVLDDHSRFALGLAACADQREATVRGHLTALFRRYGLPARMLMDNGSCWGQGGDGTPFTHLGAWLIRLGVALSHGRPYHPQTQGKDERFHRTLKAELLRGAIFVDLADCQRRFEPWRQCYNNERPHEALGLATPASRYQPSPIEFPQTLLPIEYGPGDQVRRVSGRGVISFGGRRWYVGKAFGGQPVALRAAGQEDGVLRVYYCHQPIARIDLRQPEEVDP